MYFLLNFKLKTGKKKKNCCQLEHSVSIRCGSYSPTFQFWGFCNPTQEETTYLA